MSDSFRDRRGQRQFLDLVAEGSEGIEDVVHRRARGGFLSKVKDGEEIEGREGEKGRREFPDEEGEGTARGEEVWDWKGVRRERRGENEPDASSR